LHQLQVTKAMSIKTAAEVDRVRGMAADGEDFGGFRGGEKSERSAKQPAAAAAGGRKKSGAGGKEEIKVEDVEEAW
jgi:hypothetical protein